MPGSTLPSGYSLAPLLGPDSKPGSYLTTASLYQITASIVQIIRRLLHNLLLSLLEPKINLSEALLFILVMINLRYIDPCVITLPGKTNPIH